MRYCQSFVLFTGLLPFCAGQQNPVGTNLQLKTTITTMGYCNVDRNLGVLEIKFNQNFQNTGKLPIILTRSSSILKVAIAKDTSSLTTNQAELQMSNSFYDEGLPELADTTWPSPAFVLLEPGKSYLGSATERIPIQLDPGTLAPGAHFLQLTVSTWGGSETLAGKYRAAWQQRGYLWTKALRSEPIPFTLALPSKSSSCEEEEKPK